MTCRAGENDRTWFRNERFLCINGEWYFLTRENTQEGPFDTKREAEMELMLFLRHANDDMYSAAVSSEH